MISEVPRHSEKSMLDYQPVDPYSRVRALVHPLSDCFVLAATLFLLLHFAFALLKRSIPASGQHVPLDVRTTHSMLRGQVISWRAALHRAPHYVTPRIAPLSARHHASFRLSSSRTPIFPKSAVAFRAFTSGRISYKEKASRLSTKV